MLEDFVMVHREEIVARCRGKVASRSAPPSTTAEIDHGVPMFLDQLIEDLRLGLASHPQIVKVAAEHGHDLLLQGLTPSQVVHDYGDVCQSITEIAIETRAPISSDDFRMLNRCLDDAIAAAITEYGRGRDLLTKGSAARDGDRLRVISDALAATILGAKAAFQAIKDGKVGFAGSTGMVLERSLQGAEDLVEGMRAEIVAQGR